VTTIATIGYSVGIAVDHDGTLYFTSYDNTIRKLTSDGTTTIVAGQAGSRGSADGIGSEARFDLPAAIVAGGNGILYVSDSGNNTVRRITPDGTVSTIAGLPGVMGGADGTGAAARFGQPFGLALDAAGALYVADYANNSIRVIKTALNTAATVDRAAGVIGGLRRLGTTSNAATAWQWSVVRRPADSTAVLSSPSIADPAFVPDVAGLYTFRLIATSGEQSSITTVDVTAVSPAPHSRIAGH
jgi:hypothetical protein